MHAHTHHFLSRSQGESRKQLEKQIVAGGPEPWPTGSLTHDWTFAWMNAVLTLDFSAAIPTPKKKKGNEKAQGAAQQHKHVARNALFAGGSVAASPSCATQMIDHTVRGRELPQ